MTQPAHTPDDEADAHWRRIFGTALAVFDAATTPHTTPAAAAPHESRPGGGTS